MFITCFFLIIVAVNKYKDSVLKMQKTKEFIDAEDNDGVTPLFNALIQHSPHFEIADILLQNYANINHKNNNGHTILHCAIMESNYKILDYLIENKADINLKTNDGYTSLHLAIRKNDFYSVKFLIEHGANANITTNDGRAILFFLLDEIDKDKDITIVFPIVEYLIVNGVVDINDQDNLGNTALFKSLKLNNYELVKFLISQGANIEITNDVGDNVLRFALIYCKHEIVELLVQHGAIEIFKKFIN